jgi:hypothetical protein
MLRQREFSRSQDPQRKWRRHSKTQKVTGSQQLQELTLCDLSIAFEVSSGLNNIQTMSFNV